MQTYIVSLTNVGIIKKKKMKKGYSTFCAILWRQERWDGHFSDNMAENQTPSCKSGNGSVTKSGVCRGFKRTSSTHCVSIWNMYLAYTYICVLYFSCTEWETRSIRFVSYKQLNFFAIKIYSFRSKYTYECDYEHNLQFEYIYNTCVNIFSVNTFVVQITSYIIYSYMYVHYTR